MCITFNVCDTTLSPRPRSKLDEILLFDLAESCVSLYTETRRNAQNAGESALKSVYGGRLLVIPPLLKALQKGVKENDHARIKGALFSLLLSSVAKTVGRHWKYAPTLIRAFIDASAVDKPSVQKICSTAVFQVMDYGRAMERMAILDQGIVEAIAPIGDVGDQIEKKRVIINNKRAAIEKKKADLAEELVNLARVSHWKIASRAATIVITMGLRFDYIASDNLIELMTLGSIDDHPGLRGMYSQALIALFTMIDVRAICTHEYKNYILGHQRFPSKIKVATNPMRKDRPRNTCLALQSPKPSTMLIMTSLVGSCGESPCLPTSPMWNGTLSTMRSSGTSAQRWANCSLASGSPSSSCT